MIKIHSSLVLSGWEIGKIVSVYLTKAAVGSVGGGWRIGKESADDDGFVLARE